MPHPPHSRAWCAAVPQVPERLAQAGWQVLAEQRVSVLTHVPTWEAGATAAGMPYREERHVVLARAIGA